MYHNIYTRLINQWEKKYGTLQEKYRLLFEYFFSVAINVVFAAAIGHTFCIENEMIVFAICYTVLRVSNGGNYLKVNLKNVSSVWGIGLITLYGMKFYANDIIGNDIIYVLLMISILCVSVLVPYNIQNLDLVQKMKGRICKGSVATILAECACILFGMAFVERQMIFAAVIGVLMQSISLVSGVCNKKQNIEQWVLDV